jgi:hypothetical protein
MTDDELVTTLVDALSLSGRGGSSPHIEQWLIAGPLADGIVYTTIDGTFDLKSVARRLLDLNMRGVIPLPEHIEAYRRSGEELSGLIGVVPDKFLK